MITKISALKLLLQNFDGNNNFNKLLTITASSSSSSTVSLMKNINNISVGVKR